jgi:hypothetical protein
MNGKITGSATLCYRHRDESYPADKTNQPSERKCILHIGSSCGLGSFDQWVHPTGFSAEAVFFSVRVMFSPLVPLFFCTGNGFLRSDKQYSDCLVLFMVMAA